MSEKNINLIQCGDHNWAPWSIVCIHLVNKESTEWIPIESNNPEVDYDWICPACDEFQQQYITEETSTDEVIKDLRPACIHCVRQLRKESDPNYKEEEM